MKKIRLTLIAALFFCTATFAQENGPSAGAIGVGYYGNIQSTGAIDFRYQIDDQMGLIAALGLNLIDATDIDIALHVVYAFASAGPVQAQFAPGVLIGIPDWGDSMFAIALPLRAEWFVAKNLSFHTMAGLYFYKIGDAKMLSTGGDLLGSAGFTLWL